MEKNWLRGTVYADDVILYSESTIMEDMSMEHSKTAIYDSKTRKETQNTIKYWNIWMNYNNALNTDYLLLNS